MLKITKETASMHTSDGVRLDADIYRPQTEEELPVLLMRQPYGRAIASSVVYAHPSWYARGGYIVVIQDVRGRGTSEGEFELFQHEIQDGDETIEWVSGLEGSTGEVGMYGFSYQGMTQLYAAVKKHPALKVLCPAMLAYDLYSDWAYEGDAFCLVANFGWAVQLAAQTARIAGDLKAYEELYAASRNLPLHNPPSFFVESFQKYDPFYFTWLKEDKDSPYWRGLSPRYLLQEVDLPMLHIGGWFDPYLRGTLNLYKAMVGQTNTPQHLIVGPWGHLPWGRKLGVVDYGEAAISPVDELQLRWFDRFLKGKDTGVALEESIGLFELGSNQWRYFNDYPRGIQTQFYLDTDGLASIREDSGKLWQYENVSLLEEDNIDLVAEEFTAGVDVIVHDPWRPVPAIGGHANIPSGQYERSALDNRSDIVTYTSAPLETEIKIVGAVEAEIYCAADVDSFDLCAVLSVVYPDGRVINFAQGYQKCDWIKSKRPLGNTAVPVNVKLQPICISLGVGECIRLSLSAACFPAYAVNPGIAGNKKSCLLDAQVITVSIFTGSDYPSYITIPITK